ncbi:hypothetical protein B0H10DRAFT_2103198 [Mycena sp. CBHHK59/15]|nr:hypothetical protein B0H10DRAFT_2103198 [Mycena sp. CBHHK59/15]
MQRRYLHSRGDWGFLPTWTTATKWRGQAVITTRRLGITDAPGLIPLCHSKPEIRTLFHTKFKTRLIQDVGTLPAWHGLDNWEDVADIWDNVFPVHVLAENPDLQIVVQKLAEDKLDSWHHKFATAALETAEEPVETVKSNRPSTTPRWGNLYPPQRLGEFSKTNWGDKTEFYRGLQVTITTTSALVALVNRLTANNGQG